MTNPAPPAEPKRVIHVRVDEALHQAVAAFATRTHRSLNGAATYLLETALAAEEGKR